MKVSIIGVTGYSGLELLRLLNNHPAVEIVSIHSHSQNGEAIDRRFPHLKQLIKLPLEEVNPEKIMAQADLVFFAAPSGVAKEQALPFIEKQFPVIDLSGDYRLKNPAHYEKWYGKTSAPISALHLATYGLADFDLPKDIKLIANPGCYATAAILSVAPLVRQKLIEKDSIIFDGKSGLSGAGKKLSEAAHYTEVNDNMSVYKLNQHQHIPEIIQQLQQWDKEIPAIQFSTALIPVTRGILMTTYCKAKTGVTSMDICEAFEAEYGSKPFIRLQEDQQFPCIKQVVGSNYCDIGTAYNKATQTITVVSVIDNLVKGAAGQAIQNLNLLMNLPETTGLELVPVYP
ncbi:N-acetyl-gamma-glutamyl-phosphate reductase [Enterococcus florum]|uniref:N-acetyl-gamma-glutamyl-phosphate reductase n=1 Tax=Enterococcus florum TaxID=2480627 RepID=A0A4P5PK19_9ENTE|nr:N-acetyl-gamma-glutamyl-phosphate reductase [Enterococcus florum]GCF93683.1 N-acetyl-gamma-glutamyl-phosphate reductase [Enterococcus florum]